MLERALAEPAAPAQRPGILLRRLEALTGAGDYQGLREAAASAAVAVEEPALALRAAPLLGAIRVTNGDVPGAVAIYLRAIEVAELESRPILEALLGQIGMLSALTAPEGRRRLGRAAAGADEHTPGGRALLGAQAFGLMIKGQDRPAVLAGARRALGAGLLEDDPNSPLGYRPCSPSTRLRSSGRPAGCSTRGSSGCRHTAPVPVCSPISNEPPSHCGPAISHGLRATRGWRCISPGSRLAFRPGRPRSPF